MNIHDSGISAEVNQIKHDLTTVENESRELRCRFCAGLIELEYNSNSLYSDLLGGRLCSAVPDEFIERHHRL